MRRILSVILLITLWSACVFANVIATDNFTRANAGNLGANWTNVAGTFAISSNTAECTGTDGSSYGATAWNANSAPNDQYAQITISGTAGSGQTGPSVRMSTVADTFYYALILGGSLYITKVVAGSGTNLVTTTYSPTSGDVVYLSIVGTSLTLKVNGTTKLTTTDSSISSGSFGMAGLFNGTSYISAWTGGGFASATVTSRTIVR